MRKRVFVCFVLRVGYFAHRFLAAFFAIRERSLGVRALARALPPFSPPSLPRATAWGFLEVSGVGSCFSPVARSTRYFASWFVSRGLFGFFILQYTKGFSRVQALDRNEKIKLRHYPALGIGINYVYIENVKQRTPLHAYSILLMNRTNPSKVETPSFRRS